jgi:hypothetical protein
MAQNDVATVSKASMAIITRLEAENARLREALQNAHDCIKDDGWSDGPYLRETMRRIEAALNSK